MYRRYVGVDLSEEAIAKARTRIAQTPNSSASFVVADALGYAPSEQFDVIIFNESLETSRIRAASYNVMSPS